MFDFLLRKKVDPNVQADSPVDIAHSKLQERVIEEWSQAEQSSVVDDLEELFKYKHPVSSHERLKSIFVKNEYGFKSFELTSSINVGLIGLAVGFMRRSVNAIGPAVKRFQVQHRTSLFLNRKDAVRRASTFSMMSMIYEGVPHGLRVGSFMFTLALTTQSLASYRDKMRYSDILVGGIVAGGVLRVYYGLKAMAVMSLLGGCVGIILAVGVRCAMLIDGNISLDHFYKEMRQNFYEDKLKKYQYHSEIQRIVDEEKVWGFTAKKIHEERKKQAERERQVKHSEIDQNVPMSK